MNTLVMGVARSPCRSGLHSDEALFREAEAAVFTTSHHSHFSESHLGHTCLPDLGRAFLATLSKSLTLPWWVSNTNNHDTHVRTRYEFSFLGSV